MKTAVFLQNLGTIKNSVKIRSIPYIFFSINTLFLQKTRIHYEKNCINSNDGKKETFEPVSIEIEKEKSKLLTAQKNTLNIRTSDLPYNIYVYSISGKCVYSGQNISDNFKQLNLETGFYIVNFDQQTSQKIYIP